MLSDFNILGYEGLQVLETVHAKDPMLPVIIVTGTGSEEIAVEAMKRIQHLPLTILADLAFILKHLNVFDKFMAAKFDGMLPRS